MLNSGPWGSKAPGAAVRFQMQKQARCRRATGPHSSITSCTCGDTWSKNRIAVADSIIGLYGKIQGLFEGLNHISFISCALVKKSQKLGRCSWKHAILEIHCADFG